MLLILDGNSWHVAHVYRKFDCFCFKFISYLWLLSIYTNALNRSYHRYHSTHAHAFLRYHLIPSMSLYPLYLSIYLWWASIPIYSLLLSLLYENGSAYQSDHVIIILTIDLILDGKSIMGSRAWSVLCYLICLRHMLRSKAVTNLRFFSYKRLIIIHACAKFPELPSGLSTMMLLKEF